MTIAVEPGKIRVTQDGELILRWQGRPEQLSTWADWHLPETPCLIAGAKDASFAWKQLTLEPRYAEGEQFASAGGGANNPATTTQAERPKALPPLPTDAAQERAAAEMVFRLEGIVQIFGRSGFFSSAKTLRRTSS